MNIHQQKLKASLCDAISKWADTAAEKQEADWSNGYGEYVGEMLYELMADAAFAVLMGSRDGQLCVKENA